jgi:hypothetical protein
MTSCRPSSCKPAAHASDILPATPHGTAQPGRQRFRRSEIPTCHPGRNGTHNKSDILLVSSTFADPGSSKTASQDAKCSTSRRRPAKKKSHDAMFFVKPFRRSEIPTCHPGRNGTHNKSDILLVSSTFADPGSVNSTAQHGRMGCLS